MERMVLGKTGLEMYRVGFGGIPIQRVSEKQAEDVVLHAIESGVDFVDTSRMYTSSEHRIGLALKRTNRNVILATKSIKQTAEGVLADIELSRKELGRDFIHLYQCHFVNDHPSYEKVIGPGGALEGLKRARHAGRIGHIGLTSHSLDVLERVIDEGLFETIMVCYGVLEPRAAERVIPKAIRKGIGVIAMKSFSGGVIDRSDLAIGFGLSQPNLLLIPGVETPALFDENWRNFRENRPLTHRQREEIAALQKEHEKTFCRRCDYCQPCPQEIGIQGVLGLRQFIKRMGLPLFRSSPFAGMVEEARTCTNCRICMTRCPYKLPIPDLIRENVAWYDAQA